MRRWSPVTGVVSGVLGLLLATLPFGGCSSSADLAQSSSGNAAGVGGTTGGPSGGSAGLPNNPGGDSGSSAGGEQSGGENGNAGGERGGGGDPTFGGNTNTTNKCSSDGDCVQVAGSCFVCEVAGAAKDCVDKGPPRCDNGVVEPCEMCEVDDVIDCVLLGEPGQFSGGSASCLVTCTGWDTSKCSVCGNGLREAGEDCEGNDPPAPHTCADEGLDDNPATVLPCTDECRFDTAFCGGCSKDAQLCLSDTECRAADCSDAECKLGTACQIDCAGGGNGCKGFRCNHDASCDFACNTRGRCADVVCDSDSSCKLNCAGGNCDGTVCRAGAACSFDCHGTGSCREISCQAGSDCDFECDDAGPHCSGDVSCGAGKACSFSCSRGSDCSGLAVTCPSGSTCTFTCKGAGSVCPKADCQEGASCVFACAEGDCNAPSCADDACTGN